MSAKVVSLEPRSQEAILQHAEIPGFMGAMTMGYRVKSAGDFAKLKPGQTIRAELIVDGNRSWLEKIEVIDQGSAAEPPARTDFRVPEVGEQVPAFTVIDQDGRKFRLDQHYPALVTFVYTRCPLPDYCPRMNTNFQQIAGKLRDTTEGNLHLVTISFDPDHDTPAVLKQYRAQWANTPELRKVWTFAVPEKVAMPELLKYFAVNAYSDQKLITHSLSTALISRDGKVLAWWHGNDWTAADVAQKLAR